MKKEWLRFLFYNGSARSLEKRIFRHMLGNVGRFRERPLLHTAGKAQKIARMELAIFAWI